MFYPVWSIIYSRKLLGLCTRNVNLFAGFAQKCNCINDNHWFPLWHSFNICSSTSHLILSPSFLHSYLSITSIISHTFSQRLYFFHFQPSIAKISSTLLSTSTSASLSNPSSFLSEPLVSSVLPGSSKIYEQVTRQHRNQTLVVTPKFLYDWVASTCPHASSTNNLPASHIILLHYQ